MVNGCGAAVYSIAAREPIEAAPWSRLFIGDGAGTIFLDTSLGHFYG
jgi:hypothetical protein